MFLSEGLRRQLSQQNGSGKLEIVISSDLIIHSFIHSSIIPRHLPWALFLALGHSYEQQQRSSYLHEAFILVEKTHSKQIATSYAKSVRQTIEAPDILTIACKTEYRLCFLTNQILVWRGSPYLVISGQQMRIYLSVNSLPCQILIEFSRLHSSVPGAPRLQCYQLPPGFSRLFKKLGKKRNSFLSSSHSCLPWPPLCLLTSFNYFMTQSPELG